MSSEVPERALSELYLGPSRACARLVTWTCATSRDAPSTGCSPTSTCGRPRRSMAGQRSASSSLWAESERRRGHRPQDHPALHAGGDATDIVEWSAVLSHPLPSACRWASCVSSGEPRPLRAVLRRRARRRPSRRRRRSAHPSDAGRGGAGAGGGGGQSPHRGARERRRHRRRLTGPTTSRRSCSHGSAGTRRRNALADVLVGDVDASGRPPRRSCGRSPTRQRPPPARASSGQVLYGEILFIAVPLRRRARHRAALRRSATGSPTPPSPTAPLRARCRW